MATNDAFARCGECQACVSVRRVRTRVLAVANPPRSHADTGTVEVWNSTLYRYPCETWPADVKQQYLAELRRLGGPGIPADAGSDAGVVA